MRPTSYQTAAPGQTFTIQFFSNLDAEPSGNEGRKFLGQKSVTTEVDGDVSFTRSLAQAVPAGQRVTATGPGGNTSEFSTPQGNSAVRSRSPHLERT